MFHPPLAHSMSMVPQIRNRAFRQRVFIILAALASAIPCLAQVPDLTAGGVPTNTNNINLGPTGMQGWLYHNNTDSSLSRQILVTNVEVGSPADGVLAVDDVILGVNGTGATPLAFSSDARIALGMAIGDAEANNPATLKFLRWRAGVTDTVEITLQNLGAYSATAPYNCPKSALILEQGLAHRTANEDAGQFGFGTLALLAGNDPSNPANAARQALAQAEAQALIATQEQIDFWKSGQIDTTSKVTWRMGHELVVLAEYYLQTSDATVLPTIEAMAVQVANGQSHLGTMGHQLTGPNAQGELNTAYNVGYGTINSAGMPTFLGLLLAKQCGLTNPEIDPAIQRASRYYAAYTSYGAHPYGEHEPARRSHESNGKSGLASLCFMLEGDRAEDGKFFSKMATAASSEREEGHTGAFFNQLWAPLGAAAGGEEAVAAHFSRISWNLDLSREWDGGFYWNRLDGSGSGERWNSFDMSTAALLTYALPLRELHITGRGHDPARYLTSQDVAEAIAAEDYDATARTTSELVTDLGNWSPKVQYEAAAEIGLRTAEHATLVPQLIAIANDTQAGESRVGACFALGEIGDGSAAADLAALLDDADNEVRYASADALRYLPQSNKLAQLDTILTAAASTGKPFFPIDEEDPMHFAHGRLAMLLFYSGNAYGPRGVIWGSGINGVDRDLLYPAIEAVAATPFGISRSTLNETYVNLTYDDVLALSGTILDSITIRAPADKMFSNGVRVGGVEAMEMYNIADGVTACMKFIQDVTNDDHLQLLGSFGAGVHSVEPDPDVIGFLESYLVSNPTGARLALDAINTDINPLPLTSLKTVQLTTADDPVLDLPASSTVLRVTAMDHAKGDTIYTWNKVFGPGAVTFTPNGSAAAANSTVQFDGTPGAYEFEVTMSDSRGLTESYGTVVVLVSDGSPADTNAPPATDFATPPTGTSISSVTMTAQVVTDPEGNGVKYYFTCTSGGGNDSGWQTSPTYTDTGLLPDTTYEYTVTVRDLSVNQNTSAASVPSAGSTGGLPTSTLSAGAFHILGSSNGPASNTTHNVSVNGAHAGFQGQGNVNSVMVPVDETFNGTVLDYAFIRESATPNVIETYADGGVGRMTFGSYLPRAGSGLGNHSDLKLWTATDPGSPAYSNPADITSSTGVRPFDNLNGSINISGVTVGKIYFFYSGYRTQPFFSATMKDTEMVVADVPLPVFGDGDTANGHEHYVCSINFVNNDGCDTIDWTLTSSLYNGEPHCGLQGVVLVTSTGATATVPNVVGLTQSAAESSITAAGFSVGSVLLRSSSTVPVGSVISQSPVDGISATENSAVNLVVSNGLPTTPVPNVIGLEQSIAESQIVAEGLVVGTVTEEASTTVPSGHVISHSPSSGSLLVFGASVDLVIAGNSPPVSNDDTAAVDEDSSVGITLTATDIDVGDTLTYAVVTGPTSGVLSGTAPNLTYTPNGDYNGSDSFTFKVNDGTVDSNVATISITVNAVNDAPVANDDSATTDQDVAVAITLTASDIDTGDTLTYAVVSGPANGVLSGTAPNLTYTPNAAFTGSDSFTFMANDGSVDSNTATIDITVNAAGSTVLLAGFDGNQTADNASTPKTLTDPLQHSSAIGKISVSLSTSDALTSSGFNWGGMQSSSAIWGTGAITLSPAADTTNTNAVYAHDAAYATIQMSIVNTGTDNVTLDTIMMRIKRDGADSPTSQRITYLSGDLADAPGSNFLFDASLGGTNGYDFPLSNLMSDLTLAPGESANFTWASEGTTTQRTRFDNIAITGSIAGAAANNPPVANDDSASVDEDSSVAITLTATDADVGDTLTYAVVTGPTSGSLSGTAPNLIYTPNGDYNGSDSFTFEANDGSVDSNTATISITVNAINDAPVANDNSATTDEDTGVAITLSGSDVDMGDTLTYAVVTGPASGTLSGTAPNLTYTPNGNYNGSDSFTFKANDGALDSNTATINITVNAVNDAPVWNSMPIIEVVATENVAYSATLADDASDVDAGASLSYALESVPTWLTVASDGTLSGTPTSADVGENTFTVSVTDGIAAPVNATLNISVDATNPTPGQITWQVFDISGNVSDISTEGTLVRAHSGADYGTGDVVDGSTFDINGVTFADGYVFDSPSHLDTIGGRGGSYSGPNAAYTTLMTNADRQGSGTATFTFSGLNPGSTYQIQVWHGDNVSVATENGMVVNDGGIGNTPVPGTPGHATLVREISEGGYGQYAIGTFVAASDTQQFLARAYGGLTTAPTGQANITINACQLRLVNSAPDATPPMLAGSDIADDQGGANVMVNDPVTYTVTFSEDIDEATVDAADFSNAGSSAVTIGSVTEGTPGVFTVEVSPTTVGTLQLQVSAGAVIQDVAGNALDTTAAIVDDTTITVDPVQVTVPGVVGLDQATAESNIVAANLVVGNVTTQYDAVVPAGDVISQNPAGGNTVDEGSSVDLVVSLGPPQATVPGVVGLDQATAESDIVAANLVVGNVTTQYDAIVPVGDVISQTPAGGSTVNEGTSVDLVVSLGPPMATVPNVVGLSQSTAETNIVVAGLIVGVVTQDYSETVPVGDVISQGLTAGSSVPEGSAIDLVVSLGPPSNINLVRTTVSSVSNTSWTTVDLGQTYASPVIVATPIYAPGETIPIVTRINNITATGFDLKIDRADGLSGPVSFDVSVVAVEEGVYTQANNGVTMEAVKFTSTITANGPNNWSGEARSYQNSYTTPVVIGQVMSYNDSNWSVFWSMGASRQEAVDAGNLNVGKHVGQDSIETRANETVGYIVIEAGSGTLNGVAYEADLGPATVQCFGDSATPYSYALSGGLSSVSTAAVSQSGMSGNDGAWAVLSGATPVTSSALNLHLAEDSFKDNRQRHSAERVGYIVFE